ncbi:MAG TPA: nicotinate-nucleotide--dimethylbenzimidazole phosphoribosyltransferase, partial [Acidimicrobiales bacterium]|nr:nicotinate-nucleotide--dimethylbenzimidazole phosphoribosyltransferase [Acidimicrobiales bacterium]
MGSFREAAQRLVPPDEASLADATRAHDRLTKPRGSLGRLESLGIRLAGMAGRSPPPVPAPAAVAVFAGDHGVAAEGVSPWPSEVTAQMVANFCAGGAAINVLARHVGASVVVVDVGVAADLGTLVPAAGGPGEATGPRLVPAKVRAGTANLAREAAMAREEAVRALDVGAEVAADLVAGGARCLVTGD